MLLVCWPLRASHLNTGVSSHYSVLIARRCVGVFLPTNTFTGPPGSLLHARHRQNWSVQQNPSVPRFTTWRPLNDAVVVSGNTESHNTGSRIRIWPGAVQHAAGSQRPHVPCCCPYTAASSASCRWWSEACCSLSPPTPESSVCRSLRRGEEERRGGGRREDRKSVV